MSAPPTAKLALDTMKRLLDVFHLHRWPIQSEPSTEDPDLFDSFCELMTRLSKAEQDLVLTLLTDFDRFTFSDYTSLLRSALNTTPPSIVNGINGIIVLPLTAPSDLEQGIVKSATQLLYPAEKVVLPRHSVFSRVPAEAIQTYTPLSGRLSSRTNMLLMFVDDFLGTGDTALKAIGEYRTHYSNPSDKIIVVALVGLEQGIQAIRDASIDVFTAKTCQRGISDSRRLVDKAAAKSLMTKIEDRLGIASDFRFGYKGSEALVRMTRTPNNTFPVFWHTTTSGGQPWPAPFARHR